MAACDAVYAALVEVTGVPLITRDAQPASAPGHRAIVEPIEGPRFARSGPR